MSLSYLDEQRNSETILRNSENSFAILIESQKNHKQPQQKISFEKKRIQKDLFLQDRTQHKEKIQKMEQINQGFLRTVNNSGSFEKGINQKHEKKQKSNQNKSKILYEKKILETEEEQDENFEKKNENEIENLLNSIKNSIKSKESVSKNNTPSRNNNNHPFLNLTCSGNEKQNENEKKSKLYYSDNENNTHENSNNCKLNGISGYDFKPSQATVDTFSNLETKNKQTDPLSSLVGSNFKSSNEEYSGEETFKLNCSVLKNEESGMNSLITELSSSFDSSSDSNNDNNYDFDHILARKQTHKHIIDKIITKTSIYDFVGNEDLQNSEKVEDNENTTSPKNGNDDQIGICKNKILNSQDFVLCYQNEDAVKKVNQDLCQGLKYCENNGICQNEPVEIARFFFSNPDINPKRIGEYLSQETSHANQTLTHFASFFDFRFKLLSRALRIFWERVTIPIEKSLIEKCFHAFSKSYYLQNQKTYPSAEVISQISFKLSLLESQNGNSFLAGEDQFMKGIQAIYPYVELPNELIKSCYRDAYDNKIDFCQIHFKSFLRKQGGKIKTWKKRWFVLTKNCLLYYKKANNQYPLGMIPLANVKVERVNNFNNKKNNKKKSFLFQLTNNSENEKFGLKKKGKKKRKAKTGNHRIFLISAPSAILLKKWFKKLNQITTIHQCFQN
ncbi:cytohesin-2 [Anaeramoeba flamelloides]|uniref:Cytohesin-2 n=1 Tax=Anaeramoeba flamelloides TaxID=1746091 RepID=A0ABQ8YDH1_9EUKA|nr:cytohesin-2 [Anaeramoeba flamelloides]